MKFKVGDTVYCEYNKRYGIIVEILHSGNCGVNFGDGFGGHDLNGKIKTDTGWYIPGRRLSFGKSTNKCMY